MTTYKLALDRNGNKVLKITAPDSRAFSIQTLGNLNHTHRNGITSATPEEVRKHITAHGTRAQKSALGVL